jgi:hypothetical protein
MTTRSPTTVWWFLGSTFGLALFVAAVTAAWWHRGSPLWAPVRIDPARPFRIELGRGSERQGMFTVRVEHDGAVTLHGLRHRMRKTDPEPHWVTAALQLSPEGIAEVLATVEDTRILGLAREHRDPEALDGREWVLWVRQGEWERTVYCDKHYPRAILRFAERLDDILEAHGLLTAEWRRVPNGREREHERELWESIRR